MKTKLILILIVLFSMPAFAQKIADVKNPNIQTSGTHFVNPTNEKSWSNANGDSYTKAKYNAYNGSTFVKLNVKKDLNLALNYDFKVEKGQLEIQIVDSNDVVLFQKSFTKSEIGNTKFTFKKNENYQIRFIGTDTKGSYFCQWLEQN